MQLVIALLPVPSMTHHTHSTQCVGGEEEVFLVVVVHHPKIQIDEQSVVKRFNILTTISFLSALGGGPGNGLN